jgi:hypothetical protein
LPRPGPNLERTEHWCRSRSQQDIRGRRPRPAHLRLDLGGVIEEIEAHGWDHVGTRKLLDYQYFAVFTPR